MELLQVQRATILLSMVMSMVHCHIATRVVRLAEVQLMDLPHVVAREWARRHKLRVVVTLQSIVEISSMAL